jgi:hypothetical protein
MEADSMYSNLELLPLIYSTLHFQFPDIYTTHLFFTLTPTTSLQFLSHLTFTQLSTTITTIWQRLISFLSSLPGLRTLQLSFRPDDSSTLQEEIDILSLMLPIVASEVFVVHLRFRDFEGTTEPVLEGLKKQMDGNEVPFKIIRREKTVEVINHLDDSSSDDEDEYDGPSSRKSCLFQ